MTELSIFWGETHDNVCQFEDCPVTVEENVRLGRTHLDFYAPAYYTAENVSVESVDGGGSIRVERWKSPGKLAREWAELERALERPLPPWPEAG